LSQSASNADITAQSLTGPNLTGYSEERPWGSFTVLEDAPHFKLKKLRVKPGHRLSLQLHYKREEHWIVTQGRPEITVDEKTWVATVGDYIHIPQTSKHRLANPGEEWVEIIEVQQGSYFGEDDIVRFSDDYNRL
jgi:mannose-6-phosphate isomerase-like protein (cupin superfamily)